MPTGIYKRSYQEKERLRNMLKDVGYKAPVGKRLSPKTEFKKGSIPWNKGKEWPEMRGNNHPSRKERHKQTFERTWKQSKGKLNGPEHPQWKGGKTPLIMKIRNSDRYIEWRDQIFQRDNYTCTICKDSTGGNLNAHHRIRLSTLIHKHQVATFEQALSYSEIWKLSNGMTVCEHCHSIANEASKIIETLEGYHYGREQRNCQC